MTLKVGNSLLAGGKAGKFFHILLCAGLAVILKYVYVHFSILGSDVMLANEHRAEVCYQLFFGGLFLENSMDSFSLLCSLGIFLAEGMLLNGTLLGEWFPNLELMLYRAENRKKLLAMLSEKLVQNLMGIVLCETVIVCVVEQILPGADVCIGIILYFLKLCVLTLFTLYVSFFLSSELTYSIVGVLYYLPIILLGFWYQKGNECWRLGRYFILQRGNWNYGKALTVFDMQGNQLWNFEALEHAGQRESIVILFVLAVVLYLACMRRLEKYEAI